MSFMWASWWGVRAMTEDETDQQQDLDPDPTEAGLSDREPATQLLHPRGDIGQSAVMTAIHPGNLGSEYSPQQFRFSVAVVFYHESKRVGVVLEGHNCLPRGGVRRGVEQA